jgi:hypothetical protein
MEAPHTIVYHWWEKSKSGKLKFEGWPSYDLRASGDSETLVRHRGKLVSYGVGAWARRSGGGSPSRSAPSRSTRSRRPSRGIPALLLGERLRGSGAGRASARTRCYAPLRTVARPGSPERRQSGGLARAHRPSGESAAGEAGGGVTRPLRGRYAKHDARRRDQAGRSGELAPADRGPRSPSPRRRWLTDQRCPFCGMGRVSVARSLGRSVARSLGRGACC